MAGNGGSPLSPGVCHVQYTCGRQRYLFTSWYGVCKWRSGEGGSVNWGMGFTELQRSVSRVGSRTSRYSG